MNRSTWKAMIRIVALAAGPLLLTLACGGTDEPTLSGYRWVEGAHQTFRYAIPEDWEARWSNGYAGSNGSVIEQIYPPAEITEEYCLSFVYIEMDNYSAATVENRLYDNGHVQGCYIVRDILNTQLDQEWRHTNFIFATERGVESITVIVEKETYNEAQVLTIIDSVRVE